MRVAASTLAGTLRQKLASSNARAPRATSTFTSAACSGVRAPCLALLLLDLPPLVEVERRKCQVHDDCDCQAEAAAATQRQL